MASAYYKIVNPFSLIRQCQYPSARQNLITEKLLQGMVFLNHKMFACLNTMMLRTSFIIKIEVHSNPKNCRPFYPNYHPFATIRLFPSHFQKGSPPPSPLDINLQAQAPHNHQNPLPRFCAYSTK